MLKFAISCLTAPLLIYALSAIAGEAMDEPKAHAPTDRVIIIWKGEVAKAAARAAKRSGETFTSESTKAASVVAAEISKRASEDHDPGRAGRMERIKSLSNQAGTALRSHRLMSDGAEVMQLPGRVNAETILELRARLLADDDIAEVYPDRIYFPQIVPNDIQFANQWALQGPQGINAPSAWNLTTGNANLTIGVIDTGKLNHADLAGKWIGGHDFVSLTTRENDTLAQPGRDTDPSDPGDWVLLGEATSDCPQTNSRWHGTAMAGIIGANANNGFGIAGINWNVRLLPVRVVGKCGGYESDIADGMRWAVGLPVAGAPPNLYPAKLLNVSLASAGSCSVPKPPNLIPMQSAIKDVLDKGVAIIVSAGNGNASSAANYSPGNCVGVITVGASDKYGGLPAYANTGSPIALSAPGGTATPPGTPTLTNADAIVTTGDSGMQGPINDNAYILTTGTSAAAAHVTGVAGLVLATKPFLGPTELGEILKNTSRAFPANALANGSAKNCTATDCGLGIVEARRAVEAAAQWGNINPGVAAGASHSLALTRFGLVFAWGNNNLGQLGQVPETLAYLSNTRPVPQIVPGLDAIVQVSAGDSHSLALRADGIIFAWGGNTTGQLGDGTNSQRARALSIPNLTGIVAIASGTAHSLALRADGLVFAWGANETGQLGNGTLSASNVPQQVLGLTGIKAIACGFSHSLALKEDGTIWTWGANLSGQLGIGTNSPRFFPAQVGTFTNWIAISSGGNHSLALRAGGIAYSWGENVSGQLGDATNVSKFQPVLVSGIGTYSAITAGGFHSLALRSDGAVTSWGFNGGGQLGDNSKVSRNTPGIVVPLNGVNSLSAGLHYSVAIDSNTGVIRSWGANSYGQLGDGLLVDQLAPVQVVGASGFGSSLLNLLDSGYSFATRAYIPQGEVVESNPIYSNIPFGTIHPISIANGEYRIDGGAFTSAPGTIGYNQRVIVKQASSLICNTTTTATLTILGVARSFSVTTPVCDSTPDYVTFQPKENVDPGTSSISNPVTITGINMPTPISISGGEYSIGCTGSYTTLAGSILNNETVCVRVTASGTYGSTAIATLLLGSSGFFQRFAQFSITTKPVIGFSATPQLASASSRKYVLRSDGSVFSSGGDSSGSLGLGLRTDVWVTVPRAIPGVSRVVQIAAGSNQLLILQADGSVWWAGPNGGNVPTKVSNLSSVTGVAVAGGSFPLALKNDGTVWHVSNSPAQVAGLPAVTSITASSPYCSNVAAIENGFVWVWQISSCGFPSFFSPTPIKLAGLTNVTSVAVGTTHLLALRNDGTVWAWGVNYTGVLGLGDLVDRTAPTPIPGLTNVVAISSADSHSLALRADGTVWSWGDNTPWGQLGINTKLVGQFNDIPPSDFRRIIPTQVVGLSNVVAIGAGNSSSMAMTADGKVFKWGRMDYGDVVNLRTESVTSAEPLSAPNDNDAFYAKFTDTQPDSFNIPPSFAADLAAFVVSAPVVITGFTSPTTPVSIVGGQHSVGCTGTYSSANGTISIGQSICVQVKASIAYENTTSATLTVGTPGRSATFYVRTRRNPNAVAVVPKVQLGRQHTLLLNPDGTVSATGYNGNGQLGNGTTFSTPTMRSVSGLGSVRRIASGANHTLALRSDGSVVAWGYNGAGQLGYGGLDNSKTVFVPVTGLNNVEAVAAGDFHSLALVGGKVYAWGLNTDGQLGVGPGIPFSNTPLEVMGYSDIVAIAAGGLHSLALRVNGQVLAWGINRAGQLGNMSNTSSNTPVAVQNLMNVVYISAGGSHSLALKNDGTVFAWGDNSSGQLGDGLTANRNLPFNIATLAKVGLIAAGDRHSLAVVAGGALYSWGDNQYGKLGKNSTNPSLPGVVSSPTDIVAIAAGGGHSAAIDANRNLFTWGDNFFGQIGNKSGNYSPANAALNLLRGDSSIAFDAGSQYSGNQSTSNTGTGVFKVPNGADKDYGDIPLNSFSTPRAFQFANNTVDKNGGQDLTISSITTEAPFYVDSSTSTCPLTPSRLSYLEGSNVCTIFIKFQPTAALAYSKELRVVTEAGGDTIALVGQGVAPQPTLLPAVTGQDFPAQESGTVSAARSIIITNQGTGTLSITKLIPPSGFSASVGNCLLVATNNSCSIQITFNPIAFQEYQGELEIQSNAATNPVLLKLYGQGVLGSTAVSALTIVKQGGGSGTVTGSGINCGMDCAEAFANNSTVVVTATPDMGSVFSAWNGVTCNGGNNTPTCSFTITGTTNMTATFSPAGSNVTVPGAPTITGVFAGNGQIIFTFLPPAIDGGTVITGYTVTCGTIVVSRTSSPITVSGLTNGVSYTCSLTANNGIGSSTAAVSANIIPVPNPALTLIGVQSRKTHGASGSFDLPIDYRQLANGSITVESRTIGTGHKIVFQFNQTISLTGALTAIDATTALAVSSGVIPNGNDVEVSLTNIPDKRRVTVSLAGVNGTGFTASSTIGFMLGDVNSNRAITPIDVSAVKVRSGQLTSATNFRFDVNTSGSINASDISVIKSRAGSILP